MNKLEAAKKVTSLLIGFGTNQVVSGIIRNNTQPRHMLDTISIGMTSFVAGAMAANATKEHSNLMIDEAVDVVRKFRNS